MDIYTGICTKRLASFALYSPLDTAFLPESNAQVVINSSEFIPAWQESQLTQAAQPEEIALFFNQSTALDSPDTDFPPTQVNHPLPPSPIPHILSAPPSPLSAMAALSSTTTEPAAQRQRTDDGDAEMAAGSSGEDEDTRTPEEIKADEKWEKRLKKCGKVAAKSVAAEFLPHINAIKAEVTLVKEAVIVVEGKVNGALERISALEMKALSSPTGSSSGSGNGEFDAEFVLVKNRPWSPEPAKSKCPPVSEAKTAMASAIKACGDEGLVLDPEAIEYMTLYAE